ncbi:cobalamin synthesis protein [Escherichia coli]|nr:cobalamin synthesis protein [Escherichia coli]
MCCVNGLPMQVGLNTLLRQGKPDRLLIEPTGLGHPKQILDLLTAPVYEPWIDLRATLCILDPRLLLDEKSASNENFRDQLAAADIIVANKSDRTTPESEQALQRWWQQNGGDRQLIHSEHGKVDGHLLDLPRRNLAELPAQRRAFSSACREKRVSSVKPARASTLASQSEQRARISGLRLDIRR